MAPKRSLAVSRPTKAQRAASRQPVGKLSDRLLSAQARKRYDSACGTFFSWVRATQRSLPSEVHIFESLVMEYIDAAWEEGESKGHVGDLLSGLSYFVPGLKRQLNGSWRMFTAWSRHELPARCYPLSIDMCNALAGLALLWKWPDMAVAILVAFDCLLRTGELINLKAGDIIFNTAYTFASINLPDTKGEKRTGITDSITIEQPQLVRLLARHVQHMLPGYGIVTRSPAAFRTSFRELVHGLSLHNLFIRPYSLRRGGATTLFRNANALDVVVLRGRWTNQRTARVYINTALQDIASNSVSDLAQRRMSAANSLLMQELAM